MSQMLRRSHRKSRAGCRECKRRHVKCDEQRPRCIICTLSDRNCTYATDIPGSSVPQTPSSASAPGRCSQPASPAPAVTSPTDGSATNPSLDSNATGVQLPSLTEVASVLPTPEQSPDASVNMDHMELLLNFSMSTFVPDVNTTLRDTGTKLLHKTGLSSPYLFHEMLALSARHLSLIHPAKSDFYHHQAVQLQTRAVSLFNEAKLEVNASNCMAMVLFSSLLGRHLLIDVLARRDSDAGLFLDRYTQCVQLQRGIRTVGHLSWPYLIDSELYPYMAWGADLSGTPLRGTDCDGIRHLVSTTTSLYEVDKAVCVDALRLLQIGIDAITAQERAENWCQMIFAWSVILPEAFNDLLVQRRPEALAILAHYAFLLHLGRDMWQVSDAGSYLFRLISRFLGPAWDGWLAWPRKQILYS